METMTGNTPQEIQDETLLIRLILDGDTKLFRQLAGRYAGQILRMVARMIPSHEEAEEVTQDVLLEAFQSLARYDARQASFQTWLMRIAYHTALKHYRQHHKSVLFVEMEQDNGEYQSSWFDTIPNDETDVLLDDTSTDRVTLMEKAIDMLKPDDQMLLNLYYFDNRPIREISSITEHDEGYLRSRLQWIRKRIAITIKTLESNEKE
ncbi:MAG: sigma-70 family RNA polymerase sigma factor [Prevotella sp.]|nr:sigma-70 family RNA polymerase sigma factor [Prevotella sp.]